MFRVLTSLTALFSSTLLLLLANGMLGSLLGLKLAQDSASPFAAAVVMAGYYIGLVAGFWVSVRIIQRVGHIRAFAAFCAVNISTTLILSMTDTAVVWALLRFVMGLSMMGTYMVIESWINERATTEMRGQVFAIYLVVSYAAIGGGQFMLGLDDGNARTLLILSALLFALCLLPVALTRAMVPSPMQAVSFNIGRLFKVAPHAVYGCLAAGLVTGAFYALGPTYAFAQQESSSFVGLFMGLTIFGGLLLQWPFGYLSDHFKRRTILRVLSAALAVISIALLFVTHLQVWSVVLAALWGGMAFTIYPISVAYANDRIEPEESVPAAGVLLMAYSGGAAVGPLLASGLMHLTGTSGLFLFSALTAMVLSLLEARRRGAKKVSVSDQGDYIPVPRTSVVINQLDPRAEEVTEDLTEDSESEPSEKAVEGVI